MESVVKKHIRIQGYLFGASVTITFNFFNESYVDFFV